MSNETMKVRIIDLLEILKLKDRIKEVNDFLKDFSPDELCNEEVYDNLNYYALEHDKIKEAFSYQQRKAFCSFHDKEVFDYFIEPLNSYATRREINEFLMHYYAERNETKPLALAVGIAINVETGERKFIPRKLSEFNDNYTKELCERLEEALRSLGWIGWF